MRSVPVLAAIAALLVALPAAARALCAQAPVPDEAALAAARSRSLALLADALTRAGAEGVDAAVGRLQALAQRAAGDDAVRWLLLDEAARLAERRGAPALAWQAIGELGRCFATDTGARRLLLLQNLAALPAPPHDVIALLPLADARRGALAGADRLLPFAQDAARRLRDPWLLAALDRTREDLATFRAHALASFVAAPEAGLGLPFADLTGAAGLPCGDADAARTLAEIGPERLLALSARIADPLLCRAVRRAARGLFAERAVHTEDPAALSVLARQLAGVTTALADLDGLTRLRFRQASDLRQLVFTHGRWRVEDGLLVGNAEEHDNFATARYAFAATRSVVIRGGIRSPAGLNFRFAAGNANAILDWEVAPQNHFFCGGNQQVSAPPALAAGREYTIALHSAGDDVLLFVDDALCFRGKGSLAGTVSVYPALGSEIFVREILVDGDLEGAGPVPGPRGELK
jgi:hypothetical protein